MIRRQFIKLATLTGATGLASLGTLDALEARAAKPSPVKPFEDAKETKTVHWHISGFTCITCAVGLEVMLRQQKGVEAANASYPASNVTIEYRPDQINETALLSFITGIGFKADEQKG